MAMRVVDLAQRVIAGEATLEDLLRAVEPPVQQELVQRAAVPRTFDRQLYEDVLSVDLSDHQAATPFEEFVHLPSIEAVPYAEGRFWVKDSVRVEALARWHRTRPDALQDLSRAIAGYLDDQRFEALALERLEQLLRCDPDAGRALFERLYRAADDRFNLPRCFALIELLRTMEPEYGGHEDLIRIRKDYRALYQARAFFVNEFHQTVRFLHRPSAERRLRHLIGSKDRGAESPRARKWILNLHGPGGIGKTTLLRWFVSHRLVRRRLRIPCIHIDFDAVSLSAVLQCPGLLAIEIADQLDRQLPDSVFGTMARSFERFRPLLKGDTQLSEDSEQALRQQAATTDLWPSLMSGFTTLPPDRAVVLVVDTLEDASLHRPADLLLVLQNLSVLHQVAPQLRLVLSGRYALGLEHVPEYCETLTPQTSYVRLRRLSAGESRQLILQEWPTVRDDIRDALVTRAAGNPLLLAPLVELAQPEAAISAERILGPEFDNVDEAMLIDRVIRRIPVGDAAAGPEELATADQLAVRWVVRYGVVPRRLTQAFVADVLLPFLQRALSGEAESSGDDFIKEIRGRRDWHAAPSLIWDPASVWQQLTAYATAGNHGWISVTPGDPPIARLHPDVVTPMRRLLRDQPVFARLQTAARAYFGARGRTVDVLFHELQLAPDKAYDAWREALNSPRYRDDPPARLQLAEALLDPDFASAPPKARAYAHYKAAWALAATVNHTLVLPDQTFDRAWRHLERARQLDSQSAIVPTLTWHYLEVVRLFRSGERERAVREVDEWLAHTDLTGQDRTCLLLHQAEMLVRMGRGADAEGCFERAIVSAESTPPSVVPVWAIHDRLAHRLARRGAWEPALDHYEAAYKGLEQSGFSSKRDEVFRALVLLDLSMGQLARGYARIEGVAPPGRALTTGSNRWPDLTARVLLGLEEPQQAISALDAEDAKGSPASKSDAAMLRGEAYAQLFDFVRAREEYRNAEVGATTRGDTAQAERSRVSLARMYVRDAGAYGEAALLFDAGPMRSLDQDPTLRAEWAVLRAFVAEREGKAEAARALLDRLMTSDMPSQSPHQQVYARLAQLSLTHVTLTAAVVGELVAHLGAIQPVTARLSLLQAVELSGRWSIEPGTDVQPLFDAFTVPPAPAAPGVRPWAAARQFDLNALATAHLAKALGRIDATRLARALDADRSSGWESRWLLRQLVIDRQLREDGMEIPALLDAPPLVISGDLGRSQLPAASAAILNAALAVEVVEALLANGKRDQARKIAADVKVHLDAVAFPTQYHERWKSLVPRLANPEASGSSGTPPGSVPQSAPVPGVAPPGFPDLGSSGDVWSVFINEQGPLYGISAGGTSGTIPLVAGLDTNARRYGGRAEASRIATSWKTYAHALAMALSAAPSAAVLHDARVAFSGEPEISMLPWEFAAVAEPHRFGSLLRVPQLMGIGVPTAQTRPTILVLDARFMESYEVVASGAYAELPKTLEAQGAHVSVEHSFDIVTAGMLVSKARPDVVIIVASMDESSDKESAIRITGPAVDPRTLHNALTISAGEYSPTVILNVPAPGAPVEAAAQLLARNRFAFELIRRGSLHAVLATGLGGNAGQQRLHSALAWAMSGGLHMFDVLDAIRHAGLASPQAPPNLPPIATEMPPIGALPESVHEVFPFFATALFTNAPDAPFVRTTPVAQ